MNQDKEKGGGHDNKFEVTISFNGVNKTLDVNPNQQVQAVFEHALQLFGHPAGDLGLFIGANQVALNQSVEQAGIVAGTILLLRPPIVRGGSR